MNGPEVVIEKNKNKADGAFCCGFKVTPILKHDGSQRQMFFVAFIILRDEIKDKF